MKTNQTALIAREMDSQGSLYQRRALAVLPLLVRQAWAGQTIYYGQLAGEMEMPNPRNLNFVLGAVGTSLVKLGNAWGANVPPLQAIAINKADELPGSGFIHSVADPSLLLNASKRVRRQIVDGMLAEVYSYPNWGKVLKHFGIQEPLATEFQDLSRTAPPLDRYGDGESEAHRALKAYIAAHPAIVGISVRVQETLIEYTLPTGDAIDVLFKTKRRWVAVEVKSYVSPIDDLARGVYQCVKYNALLEACNKADGSAVDVDVILALGARLPDSVRSLSHVLGVDVLDQISPAP